MYRVLSIKELRELTKLRQKKLGASFVVREERIRRWERLRLPWRKLADPGGRSKEE
jgi:DNA-binding transcriptional regulator YiaG